MGPLIQARIVADFWPGDEPGRAVFRRHLSRGKSFFQNDLRSLRKTRSLAADLAALRWVRRPMFDVDYVIELATALPGG